MTTEELYTMKLNERLNDGLNFITRVPGGWIYSQLQEGGTNELQAHYFTATFVPFNNEFQEV